MRSRKTLNEDNRTIKMIGPRQALHRSPPHFFVVRLWPVIFYYLYCYRIINLYIFSIYIMLLKKHNPNAQSISQNEKWTERNDTRPPSAAMEPWQLGNNNAFVIIRRLYTTILYIYM